MSMKSASTRFQAGRSGNARGRPKGRRSKISVMLEEARVALATRDGISPLQLLISMYRDANLPMTVRMAAASIALPYVHRRMPIGIDNGSGGPVGFYTAEQLAKLTDAELEQLKKAVELLASIANPQPIPIGVPPIET